MGDKPKNNYVCKAGPDPTNSRTDGAVATIYNNGVSVYHLSRQDAKTTLNEAGKIESGLYKLGLGPKPEPTFKSEGGFRHSQQATTYNGEENPLRDPEKLRDGLDRIRADFREDGLLKGCTIKTKYEGDITVPAVESVPKPGTPEVKVSAAPVFGPN